MVVRASCSLRESITEPRLPTRKPSQCERSRLVELVDGLFSVLDELLHVEDDLLPAADESLSVVEILLRGLEMP